MRLLKTSLLALLLLPSLAASADSITGIVTNRTHNKPAGGDDVVLIRLAQGMQEATRTKTDAQGRFTLDVPDKGLHLVRVTHDKANYFRPAPPGTQSVEIEVYDSAAKVKGVTLEANLFRIQTDEGGKSLKVVENFFVKNESTPPKTQFSERPFEFTLPEGAVIEGSAALAPGGMPVQSAPVPLPEKGHYAFLFPIRPGQTRFQLSYHLPYTGSFQFANLLTMPTDTLVIIMAKSMKFDAGNSSFNPVEDEVNAQTYIARSLDAGKPVGFTVSGAGQLPRPTDTNGQPTGDATSSPAEGAAPAAAAAPAADNKPGGGLADPIGTPDPLTKYKWWILGGLALLLAIGAGVMLRAPVQTPQAAAAVISRSPVVAQQAVTLHTVLRDELFSLETDRLSGRISEEEYARLRPAFDLVFRRALERETHPSAGSGV